MHIRHSLRSHFFGSALLLTIAASYGLLAGLSRQAWAASAAAAYLVIYAAVLLIAILSVYRAYLSLTRSVQNIGAALNELSEGRAARIHASNLPAELRGLAQASNAVSDTLTARQHALHDQSRRTALLTRLAFDLRATLDPAGIASSVLTLIGLQVDASDATIVVIGPDGSIDLAYCTSAGQPRAMTFEQARRELEHGPASLVWRHSSSLALRNDARAGCPEGHHDTRPAGSVIALPLTHSHTTFGVLTISHPTPGHFTSEDLLLFEGIAAQASVALTAVRLGLEERRRRAQALLLAIGQSPAAERSAEQLAAELIERSAAVFDAGAAALFLAADGGTALNCFAIHHLRSPERAEHAETLSAQMAAAAERAWQTCVPTSELLPEGTSAKHIPEHDRWACVALPLRHAGDTIGAFVLARRTHSKAVFSADTWAMLALFGNMIADVLAPPRHRQQAVAPSHSREPMRVIFDHLPDGLVLIDAEGRILIANDAFCEDVLVLPPRAAIGQNYASIIQELERSEQLTIEPHPSFPAARRACCAGDGGPRRWYEIDRFVVADDGPEQVIERWRDVTRQEEQRRDLLRDEQLTTMARLAASVVHEIGNPLQSVRSCLDLSREDATLAVPTAEYLELASSELRRMSEILSRLRDLYRLPSSEATHE